MKTSTTTLDEAIDAVRSTLVDRKELMQKPGPFEEAMTSALLLGIGVIVATNQNGTPIFRCVPQSEFAELAQSLSWIAKQAPYVISNEPETDSEL